MKSIRKAVAILALAFFLTGTLLIYANNNHVFLPVILGQVAGLTSTPTQVSSPTVPSTETPTITPTPSATLTSTPLPSLTPTLTASPTPTQTPTFTSTPTSTPEPVLLKKDNGEIGLITCATTDVFEVGIAFEVLEPIRLDKISFLINTHDFFTTPFFEGRTNVYQIDSAYPTLDLTLLASSSINSCTGSTYNPALNTCTFDLQDALTINGQILLSVENTGGVWVGYIPCLTFDSQEIAPETGWIKIGTPSWYDIYDLEPKRGYPMIWGEGVLVD